MMNTIYLRRNNKLVVEHGDHILPDIYLATAMKNIEYLGFTFSTKLMDTLRTLSIDQFLAFYNELVTNLKAMIGANVVYKPMYPNFPRQVMLASEAELYINAIIHYITLALPAYEAIERFPLLDQVDLKVIDRGSEKEWEQSIRQLMQANVSISAADRVAIEWVIANSLRLSEILPDEIPLKENVGFVAATLLKYGRADVALIGKYIKTATDVLRLAVAWSEGDVSLAVHTRFRKFKRAERRMLLGLLEQCGSGMTEDMLRYKQRWIRLGEILHPAEYRARFGKCKEAFDILRNNRPFQTFSGRLETALLKKDTLYAANLLKSRPGEFARKLDHLLRLSGDPNDIIRLFQDVASSVSTPVLLQVMSHFKHRRAKRELRTFFPKGNVAKLAAVENNLPDLAPSVCEAVQACCKDALIARFSKLPPLGNVYLEEQLKHYLVPFSQRSASKSLRTLVRGSRLDLPDGDTLRFFAWWKEGLIDGLDSGRVDIDLSAVLYDEKWEYVENISYTNLNSELFNAVHSGDITSAPHGASEFIDIDLPSVICCGVRYVVVSLHSFTEQPYCNLPECYVGWMVRQHPNTGEIYEPSTVMNKIDVTADTRIAIPMVIDLQERKVIWADLALKKHPQYYNNVESNQIGLVQMAKAIIDLAKPQLHELFLLHAEARGEIVEHAEAADTIFAIEGGISPFDTEIIISEYLA
ncbi:TerD family protein [Paenibacillus sinopodophylli]|uniref:TerD family protein n=1 Tax=Paenibacillus sinopodophylli TaxID=1837342 RepID=UPI00110D16B9|nr:TerD family protein [Paenibacillus sinopodophylli]